MSDDTVSRDHILTVPHRGGGDVHRQIITPDIVTTTQETP